MVFTSICGYTKSNADITPVELLISFPSNLIMILRNRAGLAVRLFLPMVVTLYAGILGGIWILKNVDVSSVKILFGIAVIFIAFYMEFGSRLKLSIAKNKVSLIITELVSGLLCGLFGLGALLAACMMELTDDDRSFKANLSMVFLCDNIFRLVMYSVTGIITAAAIKTALVLLPFMALALAAGMKTASVLKPLAVRKIVIFLLIVSGIALIVLSL